MFLQAFSHLGRNIPYYHERLILLHDRIDIIFPESMLWNQREAFVMTRKPLKSKFDTSLLRDWLSTCDQQHNHRTNEREIIERDTLISLISDERFRLIDVTTGAICSATQPQRYFALSYVWGQSMLQSRCSAFLGTRTIDWSEVPRTIRDAAHLVRSLDEKYLW